MVPSADPGAADPVGGSAGNSRAEPGGQLAGLRAEPAVAAQTGYTGDAAPPPVPGAAAPLVAAGGSDVVEMLLPADPEAAVVPRDGSGTASAAGRSSSADGDDRWARSESRAADSGERQRWQG